MHPHRPTLHRPFARVAAIALLVPLLAAAAGAEAPAPVVPIGVVQGTGAGSPHTGRTVTVEGIVSAVVANGRGGWFLQDHGDGDPATSDGLFVAAGADLPARVGERLRVTGAVVEGSADAASTASTTALEPLAVARLGMGRRPPAVVLRAPPADWERLEGMRVRVDAPLTVSGNDAMRGEGALLASFGGRLFAPTELAAPGPGARAAAAGNARRTLLLVAGDPALGLAVPQRLAPRTGSTIRRSEGIVEQRHEGYALVLLAPPRLRPAPRPRPPRVRGDLRIASLNLENLFNGDGRGGGFPTARGAASESGYRAQLARLLATVQALDPDIAALMELENDGYGPESSVAQLVAALNRAPGGGHWRFVSSCAGTCQGPGGDAIRVGLLYRADRVVTVGRAAVLQVAPFGSGSRVPLAQAFRAGAGPAFVVVANHFKSKGCSGAGEADRDRGDGQACWADMRTASARQLAAWLRTDPTGTGSPHAVLLGDFNAYAREAPLAVLRDAGWRDAIAPSAQRPAYSFVYDGQAGRLDHALLSPAMAGRLRGAVIWHSNADEPRPAERDARAAAAAGPWRSSDHDPLLLGLDMRSP